MNGLLLMGCDTKNLSDQEVSAPVAEQRDRVLTIHGHARNDEYYWVRDDNRADPDVLALLNAENAYTQAMLRATKYQQDKLFDEINQRLAANDRTVPVPTGHYSYYRDYRLGGEYPIYLRAELSDASQETVLLDVNKLSTDHAYYEIGNWSVSPNEKLLAYTEDVISRRQYTLKIKDIVSGTLRADEIKNVSPAIAWAAESRTLFYVAKDPETLLPYQVYRHRLGTPRSADVLVYEESDDAFSTSVWLSRSREFIVISSQSTRSSEIRLIPAGQPENRPVIFSPRQDDHEYRIRHAHGIFYIVTNWQANNFRLMKVAEKNFHDRRAWLEVVPHRPEVLLEDVEIFAQHLVVNERIEGLPQIRVIDLTDDASPDQVISFPDPAYTARLHSNPEIDTDKLRYVYSSLSTPETVFEYDMVTGDTRLLKQEKVAGGYDAEKYVSERIQIAARDGVLVPVSLVYRKDRYVPGTNPVYIYAYGAYGYATNPTFSTQRLSLLDRGFVYAMVHVRGGQDLGRQWYEQGKLLTKKNTFNDFVDASRALVAQGYADPENVFASGASAGGLLMGVIANEAPDLYKGIIAEVPFVDVITTMLDESIPLTAGEYDEWGDPRDEKFYGYMLSYSPYDQVKAQHYPNMLVTTGLQDSQVQYFEPVKWVSRLRRLKLDDNMLLIDIDMETGHGGASGRYKRHRLAALEYAFILQLSGRLD